MPTPTTKETNKVRLTTIGAIKRLNAATGHHFFDSRTVEFFGSMVYDNVYPLSDGTALFITSETDELVRPVSPNYRRYTVRHAKLDGTITNVGRFGEHPTLFAAAVTAARVASFDNAPHDHAPDLPEQHDETDKEDTNA